MLFVLDVHFLSQRVVSVRTDMTFNYAEVKGGSSKRVVRSHLTVDDEGTVTTNGVSNEVPWGGETT